MIVYKVFEKFNDKELGKKFSHMRLWRMTGVSSGESSVFEEIRSFKECKKIVKSKGFLVDEFLVGISAIPFSVPFRNLNVPVVDAGESINVSGAFTVEVKPCPEFRNEVLHNHSNGVMQMSDEDITRNFNASTEWDVAPIVRHIVNSNNVEKSKALEQIKLLWMHGIEAFDDASLKESLPSWWKVTGIKLDAGPGSSKYIEKVESILNANEKKVEDQKGKLKKELDEYWNKIGKCARKAIVFGLCTFVALILCIKGGNKLIEFAGGGKSNLVDCSVAFEDGENSDSSKLEKWLFERRLSDELRERTGGVYGAFTYGEKYALERSQAEQFLAWCYSYVRENRGTLEIRGKHRRRAGLREVLQIGEHSHHLVVGMEGAYTPDRCRLVIEGKDTGGVLAKRMQRIFLSKGCKGKDGAIEYQIAVRADQLAKLYQHLQNDRELIDTLQLELDMPEPNEIRLYVNRDSTPREYTLDVSKLRGKNREYVVHVENVFRCEFGTRDTIVRRYRDRQMSAFLKKLSSSNIVDFVQAPDRLTFRVNLGCIAPDEFKGKSIEELEKLIDSFWNSPSQEMKRYSGIISSYNRIVGDFKPYAAPDAIPLTAEVAVYEQLSRKIESFRTPVEKGLMATEAFLRDYVTHPFWRAGLSVPAYADEHAANLGNVAAGYKSLRKSISDLLGQIAARKNGNEAMKRGEDIRKHFLEEETKFWKKVSELESERAECASREAVLRKFAADLNSVQQIARNKLLDIRKWVDYKEERMIKAKERGRELRIYFEDMLANADSGLSIRYDSVLGKQVVSRCQGVTRNAFDEIKQLVARQEQKLSSRAGGRSSKEFLEDMQNKSFIVSEQQEANAYIKQLRGWLSRFSL